MKMVLLFIFLVPWLSFAKGVETQQAHTKVRLIRVNENLVKGDSGNLVGLHFVHEPQWHTYWINPGDSASAPIFKWELPTGVTVSEPRYPLPTRIINGPLFSFGFSEEATVIFNVKIPEDYKSETIELNLKAEWVVCKVECIPAYFEFVENIPVGKKGKALSEGRLIKSEQGQWPKKKADVRVEETQFKLTLELSESYQFVDAFPYPGMPVTNDFPQRSSHSGDELNFWVDRDPNQTWENGDLKFLLITKNEKGEKQGFVVVGESSGELLWFMALMAFLGGIILNLMPCVFPVLTLKIFSIANSVGREQAIIRQGNIFYIFGVLVSFWLIAILLMVLQKAGAAVGWGFQLQSPFFVVFLALLFVAMGFYFLDVFQFNLSGVSQIGHKFTQKGGKTGAFFTGVLAVVVASPCTAPFMGAAMGYALARSPLEVFIIFTGLGIGLASPFIALVLWPESLEGLPRPGLWMVRFKKLMALPMFATAIWLAWVLSIQTGISNNEPQGIWENFSTQRMEELRDNRKGVFVNFTAAWCISCQVNERVVFRDRSVLEKIKKSGITMLKADWTNRDQEIGNVLKSYGRAGVPLYLYFAPGRSQPAILPEILTPSVFLNKVSQ